MFYQIEIRSSTNRNKLIKKYRIFELKNAEIIDVWDYNFEKEIKNLTKMIHHYPVVAFDTEFPGITY